jgi:hypothetical protein
MGWNENEEGVGLHVLCEHSIMSVVVYDHGDFMYALF